MVVFWQSRYNGKRSRKFFCLVIGSAITAYLNSSRGDVSSFARKKFIFCGVFTVVFRLTSLGGVFRRSVSGKAKSCLRRFGKSLVWN